MFRRKKKWNEIENKKKKEEKHLHVGVHFLLPYKWIMTGWKRVVVSCWKNKMKRKIEKEIYFTVRKVLDLVALLINIVSIKGAYMSPMTMGLQLHVEVVSLVFFFHKAQGLQRVSDLLPPSIRHHYKAQRVNELWSLPSNRCLTNVRANIQLQCSWSLTEHL